MTSPEAGLMTFTNYVAEDLRQRGVKETGRQGLSAESVLRCGLLKQHRQLSYEELAFHLEDSASFRAFARLSPSLTPNTTVRSTPSFGRINSTANRPDVAGQEVPIAVPGWALA